jgi:hypothetical protein
VALQWTGVEDDLNSALSEFEILLCINDHLVGQRDCWMHKSKEVESDVRCQHGF